MNLILSQLISRNPITITVKVHPGARLTQCKEMMADGTLKIDIAAAPEKGKANRELIRYLAEAFDVPRSSVEILCGETSGVKMIRISG